MQSRVFCTRSTDFGLCSEDAGVQRLEEMLAWMPALQRQAAGHLEAAVSAYDGILGRLEDGTLSMSDEATAYTMARACEAYAALADWPGLEDFLARMEASSPTMIRLQPLTLAELRRKYCHSQEWC